MSGNSMEKLDAKILGQLLLMQSIVINLPDKNKIFSFICRGLQDVPGIQKAEYYNQKKEITSNEPHNFKLPIYLDDNSYGHIKLTLSDIDKFHPYKEYLSNLMFMIGVILEQKQQRKLILEHKLELEQKVKERTKQLKNEKRLLQSIVDNVPVMITIFDSNINSIVLNKATEDITGWTNEDAQNTNIMELTYPDPEYRKQVFEFMNAVKPEFKDIVMRTKDGRNIETSWANVQIHDERVVGVGVDISERKGLEKELINAKEKAEEADRLKTAFLANMSHEIRTPMNGIMGFTNLLQEHDLTGDQQQHYIEIIKKSGERMLNTVNDIIEISKIETGQIKVSKSKVNINEHLKTLYDFFTLEANKKGLELFLDNKLPEDESLIISDKSKLSSILTNLIKNAIKFTDNGFIKIGCKKNNEFLELYVEDSGIGIPSSRRDAIFNRFEQADIEDKLVREGSGLGLAITKSYVEMLGGSIWVESEENKGSTFFLTISYNPVKTETKTKAVNEKQKKDKVKELNILIVEDDATSSYYLSTILKDKAENIQIAKNGIEVVEICKNNSNFDLILMDIKLPGIDGLETTKRIRKFNKSVKIIAQTAHALEGDKEKAIEAGCDDYISKPINREKLVQMIEKYF